MGSFRAARTPRGEVLTGSRVLGLHEGGIRSAKAASTRGRIQVPVSSLSEKRYTILFLGTAIGG
jgi:hypothetical protein